MLVCTVIIPTPRDMNTSHYHPITSFPLKTGFFIEENKRIKPSISPSSCDVSDATEPRVSHVGEFDEMEVEGDDDDDDDGSESGGSNASQGEILDQDDEMNEQVR